MQKILPAFTALILFGFLYTTAHAAKDSFQVVFLLGNQVFRSAQEMVAHGGDGHTDEIVLYGKKVLKRSKILLKAIESADPVRFKNKKVKIVASLKATILHAEEAVVLGRENKHTVALDAAIKTEFHAKRMRQRLQSIR